MITNSRLKSIQLYKYKHKYTQISREVCRMNIGFHRLQGKPGDKEDAVSVWVGVGVVMCLLV